MIFCQVIDANAPLASTATDSTLRYGFELNQVTVMYIPPYFVRTIKVSYAQRKIFDAELDFSVSENPTLRFNFIPRERGELRAEVTDSKDSHFIGSLAIT